MSGMQYGMGYGQPHYGYMMTPAGMMPVQQGGFQLVPGINQPMLVPGMGYPTPMSMGSGMSPQDFVDLQVQQIYAELEQLRSLETKVTEAVQANGVNRELKNTDDFLNKYNPEYCSPEGEPQGPLLGDSLMFQNGTDRQELVRRRKEELLCSLQKLDELYQNKLQNKPIPFMDHYTPIRKKTTQGDASGHQKHHNPEDDDAVEWGAHNYDHHEENDETVTRGAAGATNNTRMMPPQGYLQKKKFVEEQRATIVSNRTTAAPKPKADQVSSREPRVVETEHGVLKVNKAQLQNLLD